HATMVHDRRNNLVTAAMAGKHDFSDSQFIFLERRLLFQRFHYLCHKVAESFFILQFASERIRCIFGALWNDQDRIAFALNQLFDQFVTTQSARDVVSPAVKMDDEVDRPLLPEIFWN